MKLNIPIIEELKKYNNILIIGIGGGFDIYCGLPIYHELYFNLHKNIVLANYSFSNFKDVIENTESVLINNNLILNKKNIEPMKYNPEGYLYEGLKELYSTDQVIYSIKKEGVIPTKKSIEYIINTHNIDCIIAVDGGVDSIFHGDEEGCGTILEDTITSISLMDFNIKKYLVCIGLTTEIEEKVCNYTAFKRISEKYMDDSLLGVCSLIKKQDNFKFFKILCEYCWNQQGHSKSHISSRIIPSVEGEFDFVEDCFYSFLMNLYFFFDFDEIIKENKLINKLKNSFYFTDGVIDIRKREIKEHSKKLTI